MPPGQETQITLTTLGRLKDPAQFANIILRATPDGRIIRIRDVGRVVLGAKNEDQSCRCNGMGSAGLIIFQLPDANALEVGDAIQAKMEELAKDFPDDLDYVIRYDTTPYTRQCIDEVVKALRDAIILVALVVLLFLQNWRSAIIPLIAVPVAIIGTFAVMQVMGFSLNNLTLFGLVLAIGIVVDDAIVVVEAVEHHIENGLLPRDATIKAMSQVSGPGGGRGPGPERGLRALRVHQRHHGPVLPAVRPDDRRLDGHLGLQFVDPQPGAVGHAVAAAGERRDRRTPGPAAAGLCPWPAAGLAWQFGDAAAGRVAGGPAVLAPATVAALTAAAPWIAADRGRRGRLAPGSAAERRAGPGSSGFSTTPSAGPPTSISAGWGCCSASARWCWWSTAACWCLTYWSYVHTPKGFVPTQDMGYLLVAFQLPDAASAERTAAVAERVEEICKTVPGVNERRDVQRPVVPVERQRLQLQLDVRDAR